MREVVIFLACFVVFFLLSITITDNTDSSKEEVHVENSYLVLN